MVAEKEFKYINLEWNGTIESYNDIVKQCFPYDCYHLQFVDQDFFPTNEFTPSFRVIYRDIEFSKHRDEDKFHQQYIRGKHHHGAIYIAPCSILLIKEPA